MDVTFAASRHLRRQLLANPTSFATQRTGAGQGRVGAQHSPIAPAGRPA